jgi:hypothetical protein
LPNSRAVVRNFALDRMLSATFTVGVSRAVLDRDFHTPVGMWRILSGHRELMMFNGLEIERLLKLRLRAMARGPLALKL